MLKISVIGRGRVCSSCVRNIAEILGNLIEVIPKDRYCMCENVMENAVVD